MPRLRERTRLVSQYGGFHTFQCCLVVSGSEASDAAGDAVSVGNVLPSPDSQVNK